MTRPSERRPIRGPRARSTSSSRDRRRRACPIRLAGLLAAALLAGGCAKNPVTGGRQLMLITEEQEFAIGEGADREIRKELGAYLDSPQLRGYVDRVGTSLARHGERAGLVYHFEVLDSPQINAFALPGGFVYVTRGMLERLSSEDELAMVLGHEIGHVTARHGAARLSRLYALQYGTLLGAIISPRTFANYNDLINLALSVALSRYSREQEKQSDELGVQYAAAAGYSPQAGVTVMKILKWLEGKEPGALQKWFLSHPPADERISDVTATAGALAQKDPAIASRAEGREAYLRRIDGLVVGLHNGAEMVLKDRYVNKDLAISLEAPDGWEVDLDPEGALVLMARRVQDETKELITLEAAPMHAEMEAAGVEAQFDESLRKRGYARLGGRESATQQQLAARLATYRGRTAKGESIGVLKIFLAHAKRRWTFTAVCSLEQFDQLSPGYEARGLDLRFLTESQAAALAPPRLEVLAAPAGATWESLALEHLGGSEGAERLAFYNGLPPDSAVAAGMLVKIPPSLSVRP